MSEFSMFYEVFDCIHACILRVSSVRLTRVRMFWPLLHWDFYTYPKHWLLNFLGKETPGMAWILCSKIVRTEKNKCFTRKHRKDWKKSGKKRSNAPKCISIMSKMREGNNNNDVTEVADLFFVTSWNPDSNNSVQRYDSWWIAPTTE